MDGISLEPNYQAMFRGFLRDLKNAGESLDRNLSEAHADGRQSPQEHLESHAKVLREVQRLVAPLVICLQSATSVEEIQELREVTADILSRLNQDAMQTEAKAEGY